MGKGKGLTFTTFAILGALTGYTVYMANKDKFSDETKDKYDSFVDKFKSVGDDIVRTYTAIGDKEEFKTSGKNLGNSAINLAKNASQLVLSASNDMYKYAKDKVSDATNGFLDDDSLESYDDIDNKKTKPKSAKNKSTKSNKTTKKKSKK